MAEVSIIRVKGQLDHYLSLILLIHLGNNCIFKNVFIDCYLLLKSIF